MRFRGNNWEAGAGMLGGRGDKFMGGCGIFVHGFVSWGRCVVYSVRDILGERCRIWRLEFISKKGWIGWAYVWIGLGKIWAGFG